MERRLSAILAADVVGFTRLMERDEAGTLGVLKVLWAEQVDPNIAKHKGRVFKSTGDGVLAEFPSVVNAVACAVDIQRGMASRNVDLPDDRAIQLRIGVNLGDVIAEGDDIFGDGVNVASRLEGIAPPGGVAISGTVRDHLGNRLDLRFDDMGEQTLKNIERPVRVSLVKNREGAVAKSAGPMLPEKASIAILPFTNLSDDSAQQYFSDGITEDIITELSRFRSLFVIAPHSSFRYRSNSEDVRQVSKELGVQYIVEGSVRRATERIRISAHLVDAKTGDQVWAERFDREMKDVFGVQDEVARTIAATLEGRVAASSFEQTKRKPTSDWKAYDYFLKGRERDAQYDVFGAESCFGKAVELDPEYTHANAFRATSLAVLNRLAPDSLQRAQYYAEVALSLDPHDAWSHWAAGFVALKQRKFDRAGVHLNRALALNPNDVLIAADHANWLVCTGKPEGALERLDEAMKRDPFPAAWVWDIRFRALFQLKRYEEAIGALSRVTKHVDWHFVDFAAAYAHAGRMDDARTAVAHFLQTIPGASIALVAAHEHYSDEQLLDHYLDALRKAGLPE